MANENANPQMSGTEELTDAQKPPSVLTDHSDHEEEHQDSAPIKKFTKEKLDPGDKIKRAMECAPPIDDMLPASIVSFFTILSKARCYHPHYFIPLLMPFIFSAMLKVRFASAEVDDLFAFTVAANLTSVLFSESGGNKSGALSFFNQAMSKYMDVMRAHILITDFTVEALCSSMADNEGRTLVSMHEAKKLCYVEQYKKGGGDATERIMEFQDGMEVRVARKGGGGGGEAAEDELDAEGDSQTSDEPAPKKKKASVRVETVSPHLAIVGCSHPQLAVRSVTKEEDDPIGKTARDKMSVIPSAVFDLPSRDHIYDMALQLEKFPKLWVVLTIITIFCTLVFERRAEPKAKFAYLYCDPAAYLELQAFVSHINTLMTAISGACMSGINHGLQMSAYSKSKGDALKFAGAVYVLSIVWQLCLDHSELLEFDGTLAELEELVVPLLQNILDENDARGGDMDAEAMKRGVAWATYHMQQALALQNQVIEAKDNDGGLEADAPTTIGASSTAARAPLRRRPAPKDKTEAGRPNKDSYESPVLWAAASMMRAAKSEHGLVAASWMTRGDSSHLVLGGGANGAEVSFLEAAKHLADKNMGELIKDVVPPIGSVIGLKPGSARWFFQFVDYGAVIRNAGPNARAQWAETNTKLAPYRLNFETYTTAMSTMIDFKAERNGGKTKKMCANNSMRVAKLLAEHNLPLDATEPRLLEEVDDDDDTLPSGVPAGAFDINELLAGGNRDQALAYRAS